MDLQKGEKKEKKGRSRGFFVSGHGAQTEMRADVRNNNRLTPRRMGQQDPPAAEIRAVGSRARGPPNSLRRGQRSAGSTRFSERRPIFRQLSSR